MAEFFIEILSEEIPARMQKAAIAQLQSALVDALDTAKLGNAAALREQTKSWSGLRRLAVSIEGIATRQPDIDEARRGPRADAPGVAVDGFCKSLGIKRDALTKKDTGKGEYYFAEVKEKGRAAKDILPEIITEVMGKFHWPKSMRWGGGKKSWVRSVHSIIALLDGKELAGAVDFGGGVAIAFGNTTQGHRMHKGGAIKITGAKDYEKNLKAAGVIACRNTRKAMIAEQLNALAKEHKIKLRDDPALLEEVAGLVEFPNALCGHIDPAFLELPAEIPVVVMRNHQKYFAFENAKGAPALYFATIANTPPDIKRDAVILAGNERVLRARLKDAAFFWEADCKEGIASMYEKLDQMVFFENLGSMKKKAESISSLAVNIAEKMGFNIGTPHDAGLYCKADLFSRSVGEFPELQGIIGGHIIAAQGDDEVAQAIAEHYRPQGPDDTVPKTPQGKILALADKMDTTFHFFFLNYEPTGSKDPFGLRRSVLGVIRIIIEGNLNIPLYDMMQLSYRTIAGELDDEARTEKIVDTRMRLLSFFHDRLKIWLRDKGMRHDVIRAVVREINSRADDLLHLYRLTETLNKFLATKDGKGLMAGYIRATGILAAEEKKDKAQYTGDVAEKAFTKREEIVLHKAIAAIAAMPNTSTDDALQKIDALGKLRAPIDAFFEAVIVNDDDPATRRNRLNLLGMVRREMESIADFSVIEG